jgi:hypothetical protein
MCRKWIVENLDFSAAKVRRSFISRAWCVVRDVLCVLSVLSVLSVCKCLCVGVCVCGVWTYTHRLHLHTYTQSVCAGV